VRLFPLAYCSDQSGSFSGITREPEEDCQPIAFPTLRLENPV
jgi:hypothetical protein